MLDPSYRRPPPVEHGYGPIDRSFSPYQSTHPSIGSQWQPQSGAHYQDSYQNSLQDRGYTPPPGQPPTSDQNYSNAGYTDYDGEEEEEEMDVEGYYDGQDDFDYHGPGRHSPPQPTVPLYSAEETPRPPKSSFAKGFMRGLKNFPKTVFRYGDRKKAVAPAPQPTGYVLDDPPVNSQFPMTSTPPETIPVSLQPHGGFEFPQTQHIYSERPPPISEESYTSALQEGPDPRRVGPDVVVTGPSGHLEQVPEEPANFRESPPPPMPVPQVQDTITSIPYTNTQTQTQTPGPHLSILPSQTTEMPMPMIQSPLLEPPQSQRPAAPPDRDPVPARDGSTTIPEPVTPARSTYYKRSRRDDTSYPGRDAVGLENEGNERLSTSQQEGRAQSLDDRQQNIGEGLLVFHVPSGYHREPKRTFALQCCHTPCETTFI
ncbi:hypothetical protein AX16_004287 [Volvariella volvacea WC 439]|nr:hypothetical protein AX16_004287 [Volvariella volvacea WC 439]